MIYIRTDMNQTIATGHVMRCLAIADAVKAEGEDTTFILADTQGADFIEKRGYQSVILHTKWNDMDQELPALEALIQTRQMKSILIDSYQVTKRYLSRLTDQIKTLYIDDLNNFIYPVNILICYAVYYNDFHYPARYPDTQLYLGPQYTPLRKEFSCRFVKTIKPNIENVLLMSGGSDPCGFLLKLLEKLSIEEFKHIDVICGIYNTKYNELQKKYAFHKNICIKKSVHNIEDHMKRADLAISAGGTTLYELCAVGTPTISYAMADNQLGNVTAFQAQNVIDYVGDIRKNPDVVIRKIVQKIQEYRENPSLCIQKSKKMRSLVDGQGASRIAQILSRMDKCEENDNG